MDQVERGEWRKANHARIVIAALLAIYLVLGCSDENRQLREENKRLKKEIAALKTKVTELQNAPEARFAQAAQLEQEEAFLEALSAFTNIISEYPNTREAEDAKAHIGSISEKIAKLEQEQRRQEEERKRRDAQKLAESKHKHDEILKSVQKRVDDVKNVTFYIPKGVSPWWKGPSQWHTFEICAYLSLEKGLRTFWLFAGTRTSDWLFWDELTFNVDGEVIEILVSGRQKETDVHSGGVREWASMPIERALLEKIRQISEGKEVKVRFAGKFKRDFPFEESKKKRLRVMIEFYEKNMEQ